MTLLALTADEREVIRRAMNAALQVFDWDFETRMGVTPDAVRHVLGDWAKVDDSLDDSDACVVINNAMNDLLHGVGIDDQQARDLTGADRTEMLRIYRKWAAGRGWSSTGVR